MPLSIDLAAETVVRGSHLWVHDEILALAGGFLNLLGSSALLPYPAEEKSPSPLTWIPCRLFGACIDVRPQPIWPQLRSFG